MNAPTKILPAPQKEVERPSATCSRPAGRAAAHLVAARFDQAQVFPHRQLDQLEILIAALDARDRHYEAARGALLSGRSGLNLVQAARALFGDDLHELALNIGAEIGVVPTEDL